jgi:hypothetical protein
MKTKGIAGLFVLVLLMLIFTSCHPRHVSDIKANMTKEEVVSLWGKTDLITYKTANGKTLETWEYHFPNTNSICFVTFSEDRVVATQCRPLRRVYYRPYPYYPYYYPYPYRYYYPY